MSNNDRNIDVLERILKYCDRIDNYILEFGNDYDIFKTKYSYQDACCMCILQIGELIGNLSNEFKDEYNNVRWQSFYKIRNMYAHSYEKVRLNIAWSMIKEDVPKLKEQCNDIIKQLENDNEIDL